MKFLNKIFVFLLLFLICGCQTNNQNLPAVTDISSASIVGELTHIQYWDENDNWDINSLQIEFVLNDDTVFVTSIINDCFLYSFSPQKPTYGIDSFSIVDLKYVDDFKNEFLITAKQDYSIKIVAYPDSKNTIDNNLVIIFCLFIGTIGILIALVILLTIKVRKKNEN